MVTQIGDIEQNSTSLPKLKKVLISGREVNEWSIIKRQFAIDKNIWRNTSLMEETREDYKQTDDFKQFESILLEKLEQDTETNKQLTERLNELLKTFEQFAIDETSSVKESNEFKQLKENVEAENLNIATRIKNIETAIALQEKIFAEYNERITTKKNEFDIFYDKIRNRQETLQALYSRREKEVKETLKLQEEIAFTYQLAMGRFNTNSQMLAWIGSNKDKKFLADLKRSMRDQPLLTKQASGMELLDKKSKPIREAGRELDFVDYDTYKDIIRIVLKEAGNKYAEMN